VPSLLQGTCRNTQAESQRDKRVSHLGLRPISTKDGVIGRCLGRKGLWTLSLERWRLLSPRALLRMHYTLLLWGCMYATIHYACMFSCHPC
jgi:hypothetical protein